MESSFSNNNATTENESATITSVQCALSLVSLLAVSLTFFIIRSMNRVGILHLLHNLIFSEIIYNFGFFLPILALNTALQSSNGFTSFYMFCILFGGLSALSYCTIMMLLLGFVIVNGTIVDPLTYQYTIASFAHIPSLVIASIWIYHYTTLTKRLLSVVLFLQIWRFVLIVIAIGAYIVIIVSVTYRPQEKTVMKFVSSLKYYPLIECIPRMISWWSLYVQYVELEYNYGADMLSIILLSTTGLNYAIIFFLTQKKAVKILKEKLGLGKSEIELRDSVSSTESGSKQGDILSKSYHQNQTKGLEFNSTFNILKSINNLSFSEYTEQDKIASITIRPSGYTDATDYTVDIDPRISSMSNLEDDY
jgi:hypothetical protein